MLKNEDFKNPRVFSPYYVNQSRLLDIYAILNNGLSEYTEITTALSVEKTKTAKGEVSANGGFRILNIGGSISGGADNKNGQTSSNTEKKVQTITSVLSLVIESLTSKNYLREITTSKAGDFIIIPVCLKINSMKNLLTEFSELKNLIDSSTSISSSKQSKPSTTQSMDGQIKQIKMLFAGEEIVFETDSYAVIGNIFEDNLYQGYRSEIIGTELTCLAQVKKVYPNGTELMKNTLFSKIKDDDVKKHFIEAVGQIDATRSTFEFESSAIVSISDKPVYQIEIIALLL